MSRPSHDIRSIVRHFQVPETLLDVVPCGSGHINDTFAATYRRDGGTCRYIHQRINHEIFRDPASMMENIVRVTEHVRRQLAQEPGPEAARESLTLVPTRDGASHHVDRGGNYWRTYLMIEDTRSVDVVETPAQAREAARAFGRFQQRVADLGGPRLHETIPDFHNTPQRFAALQAVLERDPHGRAAGARAEIAFAQAREPLTRVLLDEHRAGRIPERITHNDTKINNVLLDTRTGRGVCVIDLDTVMPGLALYDFGDLVRTATSPAAEDERDLSKVGLRQPFYEALVQGYLETAGPGLTPTERTLLPEAGMLITFETGLRFLADHVAGDTYFKIHRPGHNLDRCRTQFALVASMERQLDALHACVKTPA